MKVLPCGDAALLVEVDGLPEVLALAATVRAAAPAGVLDVVPAARTVLLTVCPGTDLGALRRTVLGLRLDAAEPAAGECVEIPVVYDGPDLAEVARLTGLTEDGVVAAHTAGPWRVAFGGFAPGFAYLVPGDPAAGAGGSRDGAGTTRASADHAPLRVPRRESPRTRVPAGAVGLADEFSGIYPRSSPGGWQLIGRTDAVLWDLERDPPALLQPGGQVRFVAATGEGGPHVARGSRSAQRAEPLGGRESAREVGHRDPAAGTDRLEEGHRDPAAGTDRALEVLATGPRALIQDLGRPGRAAIGVGRSGAADRSALRLANRLVANAEDAPGIEVTLGGLAVRATAALTVALAGAPAPAGIDGTAVGHHAVLALRRGQVLALDAPPTGLRTYLAVRGGVAIEPVLGSRSTDTLSGLGPPPLAAGHVLPVGPEPAAFPLVDVAPVAVPPGGTVRLRAVPGPRDGHVADLRELTRTVWTAADDTDRVGMRLAGGRLVACDTELPSEGVVRGAVQVPPSGEPVLFLADHPVTGGYPVVAVVVDADVDRAAQVRPGQGVRFRLVPPSGRGG